MSEVPAADNARPTRVRYFVIAACTLMSVLLYLDRFCVGIAEPYITQDLQLSTMQMGLFFSAFFLTYALCQVPSGWLTDRYGSRVMLVIYVLTWSLFTAMMGLSYGFIMLLLMRAAYGIGQSGAYPTSASVIGKWVPLSARGSASGIVAFGGRLGGAVAPLLTAMLIVMFVPVSEPSLFDADDMLKPDKLCYSIAPDPDKSNKTVDPKDMTAGQRIWHLLDSDSRTVIEATAAKYRPVAEKIAQLETESQELAGQRRFIAARDKSEAADALRIRLDEKQTGQIAEALNVVIRSPKFYETKHAAFADVVTTLDGAAEKYAATIDAEKLLSDEEMQRFNRLLLEKLYPDALGKLYVAGWRPVMIAYGALGLFVAAILWIVLRNRPDEHPWCNNAERSTISAGKTVFANEKSDGIPWGPMIRSGSLWMNSISQVGTNIGWMFIMTWFPRYLQNVHHVGLLDRGIMTSIPVFCGWFGMLAGGKLTDFMVEKVGLKWGRRVPWGGSRFIAVAAFLMCLVLDNPWGVTVAMSVVAVATDLGTASGWAYAQDVGGKNVGSVLGWGNMWGNLGATVSPILLAFVFTSYGFDVMFLVCAGAFVVAGLCGIGIDATKPIGPQSDE